VSDDDTDDDEDDNSAAPGTSTAEKWKKETMEGTAFYIELQDSIGCDNIFIQNPDSRYNDATRQEEMATEFVAIQMVDVQPGETKPLDAWATEGRRLLVVANLYHSGVHWTGMLFHHDEQSKPKITYIEPAAGGLRKYHSTFFKQFVFNLMSNAGTKDTYKNAMSDCAHSALMDMISEGYGPENFKQDDDSTMACGYLIVNAVKAQTDGSRAAAPAHNN